MTVKELIALLKKIENKDKKILVAVNQTNKAYPVTYCTPWDSDYLRQNDYDVQVNITLPDDMYTVHRQ